MENLGESICSGFFTQLISNYFGNQWCKRESVECNALKEWKLSIFNIVNKGKKVYSHNTNLLPPMPKSSFRHLKQGIQEFHRKYVLVPADKAANSIVVVFRLHYIYSRHLTVPRLTRLLLVRKLSLIAI